MVGLLRNVGFDEFGEFSQRFLPTEVACISRYDVRHALLLDVDLSPGRNGLQADRYFHLAWQVLIFKTVGVDKALTRHEFEIATSPPVAVLTVSANFIAFLV